MADAIQTRCLSAQEGYRLWSQVYDSQPNPMLALEERYLEALLPRVADRDVVDLGCGTGRWLVKLAAMSPRSLTGVDGSAEMLERATTKPGHAASLVLGDCENLPLPTESADLVLCSFLASYLADLDVLVGEVARIARPGADIFVTDLHPATERTLGWRRGFRAGQQQVDLATVNRPLPELLVAFERAALHATLCLEIGFGQPELVMIAEAGKPVASLGGLPAIYILQFHGEPRGTASARFEMPNRGAARVQEVRGARLAFGANESALTSTSIEDGRIAAIGVASDALREDAAGDAAGVLDLTGYLVLPGLINAHDHLEFALFPRLGNRRYRNFAEWADDIHRPDASPVRELRAVPKETRLWWGGVRNLLAGVTTVCHHNPYQPEVFERDFPVRVLRDFGWAHSLAMDSLAASKSRDAAGDKPFMLHLGEGVDDESGEEIFTLHAAGALAEHTVVIHGLALGEPGAALLRQHAAALVWCPSSNDFLFGATHSSEFIGALPRVALGSDSPLTAAGDLLDEARFARTHVGVSANALFKQVTAGAAEVLGLRDGEGSFRVGAPADFFAVHDTGLSPAETLASLSYADVELVVLGGCVQLASPDLLAKLPGEFVAGLERLQIENTVRWLRAPVAKLYREAAEMLGQELRLNERLLRV
jgi:cytosine/adenosine deaminase-related metal-dependent hydrolase